VSIVHAVHLEPGVSIVHAVHFDRDLPTSRLLYEDGFARCAGDGAAADTSAGAGVAVVVVAEQGVRPAAAADDSAVTAATGGTQQVRAAILSNRSAAYLQLDQVCVPFLNIEMVSFSKWFSRNHFDKCFG
jgi:hypothetical protein